MRIIGDIHGHVRHYQKLIKGVSRSIQVGDMGFAEDYAELIANVDPERHKFVAGNHDEYPCLPPHALQGYGMIYHGSHSFFYVSGAFSIDKQWRTPGVSWWPEEELGYKEGMEALELYEQEKPDLVITHECPQSISTIILAGAKNILTSSTGYLLDQMWHAHAPAHWFFGHYHVNRTMPTQNTVFHCIKDLEYVDWN